MSSSFRKNGISNAMTMIMARGTASSNCNQVKPPPSLSATKAGIEMKLMALD